MTFIGVAARDGEEAMVSFVEEFGVGGFPNVNDEAGAIWARYGVGHQPAFVFIDEMGSESTFASLNEFEIQNNIDELF